MASQFVGNESDLEGMGNVRLRPVKRSANARTRERARATHDIKRLLDAHPRRVVSLRNNRSIIVAQAIPIVPRMLHQCEILPQNFALKISQGIPHREQPTPVPERVTLEHVVPSEEGDRALDEENLLHVAEIGAVPEEMDPGAAEIVVQVDERDSRLEHARRIARHVKFCANVSGAGKRGTRTMQSLFLCRDGLLGRPRRKCRAPREHLVP